MRGELRVCVRSIGRAGPRGEQGPGEHNQHMLHKTLLLSIRDVRATTQTHNSVLIVPRTHTHTHSLQKAAVGR